MTAAEILAQVREALWGAMRPEKQAQLEAALIALDGCVLLTREEAAGLRLYMRDPAAHKEEVYDRWLALLTPYQDKQSAGFAYDDGSEP